MAEIRTVTTLRRKRDEIVASIKLYERQLEQAKADLAHVMGAIRIFEASGDPKDIPRYMDLHRIFKRGETWAICKAALAAKGPMTTIELTQELMRGRGLEAGDKVLARALNMRLVNSLTRQELRGQLQRVGKRKGVIVWRLPHNP
jgi:hypothetical protein